MAELRSVDPRTLKPEPQQPPHDRRSAGDGRATCSPRSPRSGIIQPPVVREIDGDLVDQGRRPPRQGSDPRRHARRSTSSCWTGPTTRRADGSRCAENLVRAAMNNVDIWRAIDKLEKRGLERAGHRRCARAAGAHRQTPEAAGRCIRPMLDVMAKGSMPNEDQLRTIAGASLEEQAQVWKKHKPKKGHDVSWCEVAHALSSARIPFSAAKFDDDLAAEYGVESGTTICSRPPARTAATPPTSMASSARSRNG